MNFKVVKIFNKQEFERVTKGIKVIECMQLKSSILDPENLVSGIETLVVSDTLSCSYCETVFKNKSEQRLHYKLDWHRFNLKQHLHGLKPVSENSFELIFNNFYKVDSSVDNKNEVGCQNTDDIPKNSKSDDLIFDKFDIESNDTVIKAVNSYTAHTKTDVKPEESKNDSISSHIQYPKFFFENENGNVFSIHRCLLYNKKEVPESENEVIKRALESGKKLIWTIIMIGGGHFAAAVFSDGHPLVHKTLHSYTVRMKQGSMQNSQDNRNASNCTKSSGSQLRRHNQANLSKHIGEILESWSSYIMDSSLIIYRAVGAYNRSVLFDNKNFPLKKNDPRLRQLPFPTRRATYSEVKRVYDLLSNMEIYDSAAHFINSFRTPPESSEAVIKTISLSNKADNQGIKNNPDSLHEKKSRLSSIHSRKAQKKSSRYHIDRAKPRKSPQRPLPDIVAKLAESSSESDEGDQDSLSEINIIEQNIEIKLSEYLKTYSSTSKVTRQKYKN